LGSASGSAVAPLGGDRESGLTRAPLSGAWPRYNEVQQKAVHNAYARDESLFDQIVWSRAHSVEFDVHGGRRGFPRADGDWYVYHVDAPRLNETSCTRLSDCLAELRAFHGAFPKHDVVTVAIDLKDDLAPGHTAEELDGRILRHLERDWVVTPGDVVAGCAAGASSLQAAVRGECGWPRLDALRGKFLFIVTGGGCDPASRVRAYTRAGGSALERVAFAAPDVSEACPLDAYVDRAPDVAFVNMPASSAWRATAAQQAGLVARVWGLNDEGLWSDARAHKAQLLATDKVNFTVDPWATTHDARGWPFACIGGCAPDLAEEELVTSLLVESGDLAGARDGFYFASRDERTGGASWTTSIAVAGSHADEEARGCLMARASEDPDAPYFAVCRAADQRPLRVQWRASRGGPTELRESNLVRPDTFSGESTFFARLSLEVSPEGTHAVAEGSLDGATWQVIDRETIGAPLVRQGLAASSHGASPMRFVFGGISVARPGADGVAVVAADLQGRRVGRCERGEVFDGFLP
jgi:hypothetical protein